MSEPDPKGPLAVLRKVGSRYELSYPDYDLIIRGPHPDWVLEAAAEIIERTDRLSREGKIQELEMLAAFGDEDYSMEIESTRFEMKERFNVVPQCLVSMGSNDYRWVQRDGRENDEPNFVERLHDNSLMRKPHDWLADQAH
ncbi:MAG: hypothetical protein AAF737_03720 [Pseudomonadota bacterium]